MKQKTVCFSLTSVDVIKQCRGAGLLLWLTYPMVTGAETMKDAAN